MENPPLEKVLKKLEGLDIRAWECKGRLNYYSPKIHTKLYGLMFILEKHDNPAIFKKSSSYSLEMKRIENCDASEHVYSYSLDPYSKPTLARIYAKVEYPDHNKNRGLQQRMIGELYEKVCEGLRNHRESEFKDRLTDFFGFSIDTIYKLERFIQPLIEKLEGLDPNLWALEKDDASINFILEHKGLVFQLYRWKPVEGSLQYRFSVSNQKRDIETVIKLDSNKGSELYENICTILKKREEESLKERIDILLQE